MRNLPLVAFRLNDAQRTAAEEVAGGAKQLNDFAKRALLAAVERRGMRVNTDDDASPVRELVVDRTDV